jgi:hypothetical protein
MSERRERKPSEVLVFIDEEGIAYELNDDDKTYVDTWFAPADGARPYIKSRYAERNGWKNLRGYLSRTKVPAGITINPPLPMLAKPSHSQ